jgi:hypothetical protein
MLAVLAVAAAGAATARTASISDRAGIGTDGRYYVSCLVLPCLFR